MQGDVGLISDTHALLRPQAVQALQGCVHIVHAGDVGSPAVVSGLQAIAPVTVVRGNNDHPASWPDRERLSVLGLDLLVLHEIARLGPVPEGVDVVVYGHSHRPRQEWKDAVLLVNPGSAGPRRFSLPVTVARLRLAAGDTPHVEWLHLL